jgi:hypothetical protein
MFKLDMDALRKSAGVAWLMANPANPANLGGVVANPAPQISQKPPELAKVATLAISHEVGRESPDLLEARLITAAMRVCDRWGDGHEAREQMRADCLNTPAHLRQDLLEHFLGRSAK